MYLIANDKCKNVLEKIKALIEVEGFCTPNAIALVANKTFLFHHLFNEDGEGLVELFFFKFILSDGEVCNLCSPNIWKLIALFKHCLGNKGYIDYILTL